MLKERDEKPRLGQWGLPGGTIFKGERISDAAKRIVRADIGLKIDVLGYIGHMEFPNEERKMEVDGKKMSITIDSVSIVVLARARSTELFSRTARVGWFKNMPPVKHEYHTPFSSSAWPSSRQLIVLFSEKFQRAARWAALFFW